MGVQEAKILMPANEKFFESVEVFFSQAQKIKIRANNVRQYVEGIIDLLLKDKIISAMGKKDDYNGLSMKKKLKILEGHYDKKITQDIRKVFEVGGKGSHFSGKVEPDELNEILHIAIHIVEEIFVKYFTEPEHRFGTENIFTIFSMLPLKHRIYILERLLQVYINNDILDRLSLAYVKNGDKEKAVRLLTRYRGKHIEEDFFQAQIEKINRMEMYVDSVHALNRTYGDSPKYMKAIARDGYIIVGLPSSNDIFDTQKAVETFRGWLEDDKEKYPEFINLFMYLMITDDRIYQ